VMPRAAVDANRLPLIVDMRQLVAASPDTRIWDPISQFCDAASCQAERDHQLIFRDDDHISVAAAEMVYPSAASGLRWTAGLE
jgi:SGNH domain (fused to AT3 domains)